MLLVAYVLGVMTLVLGMALLVFLVTFAGAQTPVVDACMSSALVTVPPAGDITITNAAGGVQVLAANGRRCSALITNTGGVTIRCAPTTFTVTATVGTPVIGGATFQLSSEGRQAWKCISTTGSTTTVAVTEAVQ